MSEESRLRWQCRRGMRELDVLLVRYLERRYPIAGDPEKDGFRRVLALPDPELNAYLLQGQKPDSAQIADVIERILRHPHT
jgi:antitoxin CptB